MCVWTPQQSRNCANILEISLYFAENCGGNAAAVSSVCCPRGRGDKWSPWGQRDFPFLGDIKKGLWLLQKLFWSNHVHCFGFLSAGLLKGKAGQKEAGRRINLPLCAPPCVFLPPGCTNAIRQSNWWHFTGGSLLQHCAFGYLLEGGAESEAVYGVFEEGKQ